MSRLNYLLAREFLPRCHRDGARDLEARMEMMAAASMAAVAFQKGRSLLHSFSDRCDVVRLVNMKRRVSLSEGLGAVHGLSEPIGAVFDTQHGLTNAVLLPYVIRANGVCCPDRIGERYLSTGMCGNRIPEP